MQIWIKHWSWCRLCLLVLSLAISACTSLEKKTFSTKEHQMRDILRIHLRNPLKPDRDNVSLSPVPSYDLEESTLSYIDNPDLLMWVHAHLVGGVLVPGYMVGFPLYLQSHPAFVKD